MRLQNAYQILFMSTAYAHCISSSSNHFLCILFLFPFNLKEEKKEIEEKDVKNEEEKLLPRRSGGEEGECVREASGEEEEDEAGEEGG